MNLFFDIPVKEEKRVFNAVIEIPKNSRVKYEYNKKYGAIVIDRLFRTPILYPQNYGFFPQTWNKDDNDPLDVIVVSSEAFMPGVVVPVRIIGMIEMEDTGELDHKIVAVPYGHSDYSHCEDIKCLDSEVVNNLQWFLSHYKDQEPDKHVNVIGVVGRKEAIKFLEECIGTFEEEKDSIF